MIRGYVMPRTGIKYLKRALDAYALRQRVTSENIANVQTPGYRSRRVSFEENLEKACTRRLRLTSVPMPPRSIPIRMPSRQFTKVIEEKTGYSNGTNNVNMETEMIDLASTNLLYNMGTKLTRGRVEMIRSAITGKHR